MARYEKRKARFGIFYGVSSTLRDIAANGNRGHVNKFNNGITCADGTYLSVIAGGGTYSVPRVPACLCGLNLGFTAPAGHDYAGPYTAVEAWLPEEPDPMTCSVGFVENFIKRHGGESVESRKRNAAVTSAPQLNR